jgi:hypothetical protein
MSEMNHFYTMVIESGEENPYQLLAQVPLENITLGDFLEWVTW